MQPDPLVLIADDDPTLRLLASSTLGSARFRVALASDGKQALELFDRERPDLVLLDVDMPGMSGFHVCRSMRERPDASDVPIVMMTGRDDEAAINAAYDSGATDFLAKPVQWALLPHRARYVLRGARASEELREAQARNSAILDAIPDMIFTLDGDGVYVDCRAGIHGVAVLPSEQPVGRNVSEVLPPELAERFRFGIRCALEAGTTQTLFYSLAQTEREHHYEARIVPSGKHQVVAVVRDVTMQRKSEEDIRRLAYFDSLTGLPNRRFIIEHLERELHHAEQVSGQLALLFVDLDGFKRINDSMGHNAGDELLQAVARRLRGQLRSTDVVSRTGALVPRLDVGRLGGDEFTIVVANVEGEAEASSIARRINDVLGEPMTIAGRQMVVTTSLGMAMFPRDGGDAMTLLRHADTAMYHAKESGRNNWQMYNRGMTAQALQRVDLEQCIRQALADNEFQIHYQPQVLSSDGTILGLEALLRWNHPERGHIPPATFVPVAEDSSLIVPVGDWVLRQVCAQLRRWQQSGLPPVRVAVNVSRRQLDQPEFVDSVLAAIREAGITGDALEVELTESMLMSSDSTTIAKLTRLRDAGVTFAIDDFGTGYSSMSYLKRFPIGCLKVDRSFVQGLPRSLDDAAIATAIISMAHSLRMQVVAEGVETPEQAAFLRNAGCDRLQGYLFGKPTPAAQIEPMLLQGFMRRLRSVH
jgi:diguanylate cyclase (GGDEF)-like protein/PAS domain S-box-containing protein